MANDKKPETGRVYVYQIKTRVPLEAGKEYKIVFTDKRQGNQK